MAFAFGAVQLRVPDVYDWGCRQRREDAQQLLVSAAEELVALVSGFVAHRIVACMRTAQFSCRSVAI
jgi:hypothetical protein